MGNDVVIPTASRPVRPELRASLVLILDKEAAPDVGWQPPDDAWIARHKEMLEEALAEIQAALQPASESFIREKLATLGTYKGSQAGVVGEWKLRAREYIRLLGHYPPDIWETAVDQCALGSRWFPDLSELNELMHAQLVERRCRVERLEAMLKPKPAGTVWRHKEQAIKAAIGADTFDVYLTAATPHSDDGNTLILLVPNKQAGMEIRSKFGPTLERILNRKVMFLLSSWARAAARDRQAGADQRESNA